MEEKTNWEQPKSFEPQVGETDNTNNEVEEKGEGSLGKFKDAETLLSAYNSLQAEFTRKCQRLSALEKQNEEQNYAKSSKENDANIPLYERENWSEIVADFLTKNEDAKLYSKDICDEIMNNKDSYKDENSLFMAYAKVMKNHFIDKSNFLKDGNFVKDYVLSSDEIKDKVMKIYLDELSSNKPPKVISSGVGTSVVRSVVAPKSLEEANNLFKQMIEN